VRTPFWDADARFSPDGRWIAYQSDVSGRPEIYVRGLEEGSPPRVVSIGGGSLPRWSGRELYYYSSKETIMSVSVAADGSVDPSSAKALFHADLSTFEPMPDGSRFLVQPAEDTHVPIRVVSDWTARLRQ
jgi:serine/threonine-protein kinase